MHRLDRFSLIAAAAFLAVALVAHPAPVMAQTPPPVPPADDGGNTDAGNAGTADDDLPEPVSRRTGESDGPPPVTPADDGPPPVTTDDDGPPPVTPADDGPPAPPVLAYYVVLDGGQQGPLDENALVALIKSGKLVAGSKVWTKGMADWDSAGNVAEIAELLAAHAPPPPPPAGFYIADGGQRTGPFTPDQIKAKIAAGEFTARTQVWRSGMAGWTPAGDVPELASMLKDAPAPVSRDAVSFMTGRWELGPLQVPVEGAGPGSFKSTIDLLGNGQYRITVVLEYQFGQVPLRRVTNGTGTYTAKYKSADKITIVAKGQSTTTLMNLSNGQSNKPIVEGVDFSFDFRVIDQNSIDDGSAQPWRRIPQ